MKRRVRGRKNEEGGGGGGGGRRLIGEKSDSNSRAGFSFPF